VRHPVVTVAGRDLASS